MTSLIRPDWPAPPNIIAGTSTKLTPETALPRELRFLNQVHGATVVPVTAVRESPGPLDADAVTASAPGDYCAVRTADCLPILICARDGSEVAAAHGGWRGVAAGIIEATIAALDTAASDLLAWLGPAISQANFEVGSEVRDAFVARDAGATECFAANARGRWQADLYGLARRRLHNCGVKAIYGDSWCTYRDARLFYSYRRDADTDRMVTFIHLK